MIRPSLLLVLLVALQTSASPSPNHSPHPTITWSSCPSQIPPGVDCGTIAVPLAYQPSNSTSPKGDKTIHLSLTRLNSTGKAKEGVLFYNPGGPGGSATLLVAAAGFVKEIAFSSALREAYDIIGLDPRGVGQSTPVKCDPDIFNERVPTFVHDEDDYHALVNYSRRLGKSCAKLTGPLINHLDTIQVAKDHELVRQALGAPKFNLLGISYGSQLGSQYLSLFPKKVGRMALDGLVDHSQSETSTLLAESVAYETTLDRFFSWCDSNSTCALHGKNPSRVFDKLLARADGRPIPAPGCKGSCRPNVTGEEIRYNVQNFLIFVDFALAPNWITLGEALAEASKGNATLLSTPLQKSRIATSQEGSPYLFLAIGCQDWLHRARSATDLKQKLLTARTFAPRTRGASQSYYYQSKCLGWPAPVTNGQAYLGKGVDRAPPVLLVNSVYDPECSMAWAEGLREQLPSGVSITRDGLGHTSHFLAGETSRVMDRYLATGKLPKDGSVYKT
ncbi:hypothetical protein ACJ41O_003284 [Fusarium nematophilum]